MKTYRLRLVRFDRPQTQIVTISSETEAIARARAQAQFGRGWRVTSAEIAQFI